MNKNLVKLIIILLIGFITILFFSSLTAQSSRTYNSSKENIYKASYRDVPHPADLIYVGLWYNHQIPYEWRDSIKGIIRDTAFMQILPLIGRGLGAFNNPVSGKVTSRFGPRRYRYHYGTDINLNTGDTVVAAFSGKVRMATYHYGYGRMIVIRHYNGLETVYGHFSKILVDTNQYVRAGDPIGLGGNTGRSYGSHLHFETRYLGVPFNPELLVDFEEGRLINDTLILTAASFKHIGSSSHNAVASSSTTHPKYHKIRQGENLSVIAKRHGTTVSKLCQLNNISRASTLQIGRTLRIR